MRLLMLALACALTGCASVPGLYADFGAGYKLDSTSELMQPWCHSVKLEDHPRGRAEASCGGDNPTAHIALGFEFERGSFCEYKHWSHYFDGGSMRELHSDEIVCSLRLGGRLQH